MLDNVSILFTAYEFGRKYNVEETESPIANYCRLTTFTDISNDEQDDEVLSKYSINLTDDDIRDIVGNDYKINDYGVGNRCF